MKEVRTRFAPSPTGFMHLGGLRTALYNYLFAKKNGGKFILRIEDTDQKRFVEGATEVIYNTLRDSGMNYDEGPDVGGDFGPYIQSQRMDIYKKYAEKLVELGGAYYCFCDKERIESLKDENGIGRYDKHCLALSKEEVKKRLDNGEPYVIRQNIPLTGVSCYHDEIFGEITIENKEMEDGVLLKSDGLPTYNFANVVDDHLMGITHILRGTEYLSSTPKYNLMYDAFGWERPVYIHLPPIMKDAHRKLSKRDGDAYFEDFLQKGYIKEAIVNYIALLGWSPKDNEEKMSLDEMEQRFSLEGVSKSSSIFDEPKLRWLSGEYIKEMTDEQFLDTAMPFIKKSKVFDKGYDLLKIAKLLKTRVEVLGEIPEKIDFLEEYGDFSSDLYFNKKNKTDKDMAKAVLIEILNVVKELPDLSHDSVYPAMCELATKLNIKSGAVLWCFRIAISAKGVTPGGATELADLLGKQKCIERLTYAINIL